MNSLLSHVARVQQGRTLRTSSWDKSGRNQDWWMIPPGETSVLADIQGPGCITHLWLTQRSHYRECLIKITWDNARHPSVLCPLGDFFGLGHGIVNSYESLYFTASTNQNNQFNQGCALNCYLPMFFRERALIEIINESAELHMQFFYIDYKLYDQQIPEDFGYFHAEFRRENPFRGWGHEIRVNTPEANIVNKEKQAWRDNYVILDAKGQGHYIGCNISVTNLHDEHFKNSWWGEGDDMIWVDGYKWPPDLHGTGSEDYLNQAWGMQPNAFLRNGSSIHEKHTNGYQTSYVFHVENPVRFQKEIKVTMEHGHGNHLANEMSSVAYWYALEPGRACAVPKVTARLPISRDFNHRWTQPTNQMRTTQKVPLNPEMKRLKAQWKKKNKKQN
jgi:hypothetical protein